MQKFNERTNLISEYKQSFERMKGVQEFLRKHETTLSISPEDKPVIDSFLEADHFVVPPKLAYSVNLGEVVASADYIGDKLHTVQSIVSSSPKIEIEEVKIEGMADETSSKGYMISYNPTDSGEDKAKQETTAEVGDFVKFREDLMVGINSTQEVANKSPTAMNTPEAYDYVGEYYDSLTDMQIASTDMANMVRELEEDEKLNAEGQPQNQTQQTLPQETHPNTEQKKKKKGLWRGFLDAMKSAVVSLKRIPGKVAEAAESVSDFITSIPDRIKEGFKKVIDALRELARKFKGLIVRIIEGLFKFIPTLGRLAKEAGYGVSKIEIEIPSIEMSSVSFFGIPIPIPKISAPKMTMSIEPTPAEPKKAKPKKK